MGVSQRKNVKDMLNWSCLLNITKKCVIKHIGEFYFATHSSTSENLFWIISPGCIEKK